MRLRNIATLTFIFLIFGTNVCNAGSCTGTGVNPETGAKVSATATWSISGDILTIVLQNTTAGGTINRGDVLQGVAFSVSGASPTLKLTSTSLTSGSKEFTDKTTSTTVFDLNGGFTDQVATHTLSTGDTFNFGVSSTGFNGVFKAGTLTKGNGGTDYGIIAAGTTFQNGFSASAFPLTMDSVTFTFSGATGLSESQLTDFIFLFGTEGTGVIRCQTVPEPATFALAAIGAAFGGGYFIRRRKSLN